MTSTHFAQAPQVVALVDDELEIVQALEALLSFTGHRASGHPTAESLLGALDQRHGQLWVNLQDGSSGLLKAVVLDMNLPGMNGADLALALRRLQPDLRIVMITASTEHQRVERMRDLQGITLLAKPFTLESFERALQGA